MKTRSFVIDLLLLTSILYGASAGCAAPTPSPTASQTPSATRTPTSTPTAAPTATPTESPLPARTIPELQKTLGDKYKLTQEGDYFVIDGIDNLKFNQDGTAELAYDFQGTTKNLTIAFQAISTENEALQIGPWQNKDGEWTILTTGAPKTIEGISTFPSLAIIEDHPKVKEMLDTIHLYQQMSLAKSETYNPANEFEGINITLESGDVIENIDLRPSSWREVNQNQGGVDGVDYVPEPRHYDKWFYYQYLNARPEQIVIDQGYFNLKVLNSDGSLKYDFLGVPIIAMNSDKTLIKMTGLINLDLLEQKTIDLMTRENRGHIKPLLIKGSKVTDVLFETQLFSDEMTRLFFEKYNAEYFRIHPDLDAMSSLPTELSTVAFLDFLKINSRKIRQ